MTEKLKELLKNAKTGKEAKQILENHKTELNDDELAAVSGGLNEELRDAGGGALVTLTLLATLISCAELLKKDPEHPDWETNPKDCCK